MTSDPQIGTTRVRNGRVWRLYEIELEGEKWEDIGPAPLTLPAEQPAPDVREGIARIVDPEAMNAGFDPDRGAVQNDIDRDQKAAIAKANAILALIEMERAKVPYQELSDLHTIKGWLHGLASAPDLNDVVADGGITSGMVYQQEATNFAGCVGRILAALSDGGE